MKRKSRGRSKHYYDPRLGSIQYRNCEEIFTENRFQILNEEDDSILKMTSPKEDITLQEDDFILHQRRTGLEHFQHMSNNNFSESDSLNIFMSNTHLDNVNYYMYKNNKNFCSGYFPDFITLDDPMYYQLSNNNNHRFYYLKTQNGKYLKYLSNKNSKYNNVYFNEMTDAYRISSMYSNISLISDKSNNIQTPQTKASYQKVKKKIS